jgi:hypothetical protein
MQIPDSIQNITTDVTSSKLMVQSSRPDFLLEEAILLIKKSLDLNELSSFETGLNFYKTNLSNDKLVVKNLLHLLSECFCTGIKNNLDLTENHNEIISAVKTHFVDGAISNFDAFYNALFLLNKQKNILDVKDFTFIILGYAISLIKRSYNSRN